MTNLVHHFETCSESLCVLWHKKKASLIVDESTSFFLITTSQQINKLIKKKNWSSLLWIVICARSRALWSFPQGEQTFSIFFFLFWPDIFNWKISSLEEAWSQLSLIFVTSYVRCNFEVKGSKCSTYTCYHFLHKLEVGLMVAKNHKAKVHEPLAANFFSLYGMHHFQNLKN